MNFFLFSICKEQTTGLCCYARITRHHGRFGVVVSTLMDRLQDSCAYFMLAQQLTVSLGYRIIGKKWQSVPMLDYTAHLEKLRKDAAECARVRDHATDKAKRELFDRL